MNGGLELDHHAIIIDDEHVMELDLMHFNVKPSSLNWGFGDLRLGLDNNGHAHGMGIAIDLCAGAWYYCNGASD